MAQCRGITRKGTQCRRDARSGSDFCSIHQDQAVRPAPVREPIEWDRDALMKAALGFALVGAIILLRYRR